MKRILNVCLIFLPLIFMSCSGMYSSVVDMSPITNKTSYKSFEELTSPIVINMPVNETLYLFGDINNLSKKNNRLGDIFVVIDGKTMQVYDWVFYSKSKGHSTARPVKAGAEQKYYQKWAQCDNVAVLDPAGFEVESFNTNMKGTFYNTSTLGNICITEDYTYDPANVGEKFGFKVFDCETKSFSKDRIFVFTDNLAYIPALQSAPGGSLWFSYTADGYSYFADVDSDSKELNVLETKILSVQEGAADPASSEYSFYCNPAYVDEDFMFVFKSATGTGKHANDKLYLLSFANGIEELSEFSFEETDNVFKEDVVYCNGEYYLICGKSDDFYYNAVYKLNLETLTAEKIGEFTFWYTDEILCYGSKMYFINSWNQGKVPMSWFDVETVEQGETVIFTKQEITGVDF